MMVYGKVERFEILSSIEMRRCDEQCLRGRVVWLFNVSSDLDLTFTAVVCAQGKSKVLSYGDGYKTKQKIQWGGYNVQQGRGWTKFGSFILE
jgi:hypothetical protein